MVNALVSGLRSPSAARVTSIANDLSGGPDRRFDQSLAAGQEDKTDLGCFKPDAEIFTVGIVFDYATLPRGCVSSPISMVGCALFFVMNGSRLELPMVPLKRFTCE